MSEDQRTIYCSNLSDKVDEEIIYELFLQAGPIERVNMPKDAKGDSRGIAFIEYSHEMSVPYALEVFSGTKLFHRVLNMRSRNNSNPVQLTPQYIEANNPLTAPSSSLRFGGNNNGHLQPGRGYPRPPPSMTGNPFEQIKDPALLVALTANFQAQSAYQDLGKYEQRDYQGRDDERHRGSSYRNHDQYNPYKNDDRRDDGGQNSHRHRDRDRGGRDWTNGSRGQGGNSSNRRRF